MAFNSLTFLPFFAVVLLLHNLPLPWKVRKLNLLLASYIFYAGWDARFLPLILFSTLFNWWIARKINKQRLRVGIVINLLLLGIFKYTGFILGNLFSVLHVHKGIPSIILPLGISFYTFQ